MGTFREMHYFWSYPHIIFLFIYDTYKCYTDEHRLEDNLSKILRSTPVRSSNVLFLALLRSCAMDVSQAVATINYGNFAHYIIY